MCVVASLDRMPIWAMKTEDAVYRAYLDKPRNIGRE